MSMTARKHTVYQGGSVGALAGCLCAASSRPGRAAKPTVVVSSNSHTRILLAAAFVEQTPSRLLPSHPSLARCTPNIHLYPPRSPVFSATPRAILPASLFLLYLSSVIPPHRPVDLLLLRFALLPFSFSIASFCSAPKLNPSPLFSPPFNVRQFHPASVCRVGIRRRR